MESALKYPDLKAKVNCVPFCEEDCISLALLAKKRKIDVRFIEMMPIGNGKISTEKCLKKYIKYFTTKSAIMKYIKKE